ncbi:hypothetical protein H6A33_01540 [Collinsella tanakaei]|nr:hypothetical protein [Collinsella tanakaei]MBM6784899.1 hypothetical protein [Collinsella tanakaei]
MQDWIIALLVVLVILTIALVVLLVLLFRYVKSIEWKLNIVDNKIHLIETKVDGRKLPEGIKGIQVDKLLEDDEPSMTRDSEVNRRVIADPRPDVALREGAIEQKDIKTVATNPKRQKMKASTAKKPIQQPKYDSRTDSIIIETIESD